MHTTYASFCPEAVPAGPRPRKILLLGPNGQVGWELRRSLQLLGEVTCAGRPREEHERTVAIDLAQPQQIRDVVRAVAPALIVNAAAYTAVDKAESEPALAMAVNGHAPGILAEEARRLGAALVHYSTDYVFNGGGQTPWKEDDPIGPLNYYGATKLAGEQAIQSSGAAHLILRVSWVYGLHGANFVKTMLRLGAQRGELSIVDDQIGAPTSARVIADATAQILAQGQADWTAFFQQHGGVVHLACSGFTSWHGFATRIFNLARQHNLPLAVRSLKPIPTREFPTPARRPHNSRMDCTRLLVLFGLRPPHWETALEQSFPATGQAAATCKAA